VAFESKSKLTRMRLPAVVLAGNESDKVLLAAGDALAAIWTDAIGLDVLLTVMLIVALVAVLPERSLATTAIVCVAFVSEVVTSE